MHRNTFIFISILTMILLTGSLMAWSQTVHINTNYEASATLVVKLDSEVFQTYSDITILPSSNNTQIIDGLSGYYSYTIIVTATRPYLGQTISDTDEENVVYTTGPITLNVDLSGLVPDDPPVQD